MLTIQGLQNRIIWDKNFGQGSFKISYYDRVGDKIIKIPLPQVIFIPGDHFSFRIFGPDGEECSIPFHRVREVYKNGELIWQRHVDKKTLPAVKE